ncbi:hypothetical protein ON010_g13557 [Phytophthora cinnamomi]|nr:hypothetical protein ON010_g13557 [Phytophthora cinnamomi]
MYEVVELDELQVRVLVGVEVLAEESARGSAQEDHAPTSQQAPRDRGGSGEDCACREGARAGPRRRPPWRRSEKAAIQKIGVVATTV